MIESLESTFNIEYSYHVINQNIERLNNNRFFSTLLLLRGSTPSDDLHLPFYKTADVNVAINHLLYHAFF